MWVGRGWVRGHSGTVFTCFLSSVGWVQTYVRTYEFQAWGWVRFCRLWVRTYVRTYVHRFPSPWVAAEPSNGEYVRMYVHTYAHQPSLTPAADCCFKCEPLSGCTMVLDDLDSLVPSEAQGVLREKLRSYVGTYVSRQRVRMLHDMISFQLGLEILGQVQKVQGIILQHKLVRTYVRGMKVQRSIRTYVRISGAPRIPDPRPQT